jgi:hypothetical protein
VNEDNVYVKAWSELSNILFQGIDAIPLSFLAHEPPVRVKTPSGALKVIWPDTESGSSKKKRY